MRNDRLSLALAGLLACASVVSTHAQRPAEAPRPNTVPAAQDRDAGNVFSDGWITMKIHSQFVPEDVLDESDIDVDTHNGVVTLTGTVPSAAAKTRAVTIARATDGVKNVTDRLTVTPASTSDMREAGRDASAAAKKAGRSVNDGWITSKIYSQFLTEDNLDNSDVDIDVNNGVVTLSGTVDTTAAKTRAVAVAKGTDGVKDVKDNLKVSATAR